MYFEDITMPAMIALIISFGMGVTFALVGFFSTKKLKRLKKNCTEQTTGRFIDMEESVSASDDDEGRKTSYTYTYTYYPVFEYSAYGRSITKKSLFGTGKPRYNIGDELTVLFNPQEIEDYYIPDEKGGNKAGVIFLWFGLFMVALAILVFLGLGYGILEIPD